MAAWKKTMVAAAGGGNQRALVWGGTSGLHAVDISDPANMSIVDTVTGSNAGGNMWITLDRTNKKAYASSYSGDSINSFDYTDPSNLQALDVLSGTDYNLAWGIQYVPDYDGVAMCVRQGTTGTVLSIDVSDPSNMSQSDQAGGAYYNQQLDYLPASAHSGSYNVLYTTDRNNQGNLTVYDYRSISNVQFDGSHNHPTNKSNLRGVCVDKTNGMAYTMAEGSDTVHKWDLLSVGPYNPSYQTSVSDATNVNGPVTGEVDEEDEILIVSLYDAKGVAAFDCSGSGLTRSSTLVDTTNLHAPWGVALDTDRKIAFIQSAGGKLAAVDYSNPASMSVLGSLQVAGGYGVAVDLFE
jgi:hypothetical protein